MKDKGKVENQRENKMTALYLSVRPMTVLPEKNKSVVHPSILFSNSSL